MDRRQFLKLGATSGAGLTLGWRLILPARGDSYQALVALSQEEARILAAIYAAIVLEKDPVAVKMSVQFMDRFLRQLARRDLLEFKLALRLVEHTPIFFHGFISRFTKLSFAAQQACLEGWRDGAAWRRPVFSAMKEFSYLAHYTKPGSWAEIGYTGPWVGPVRPATPLDEKYTNLLARALPQKIPGEAR